MSSIAGARAGSAEEGLQTFDPSRHMHAVAELVGAVFADELDYRARRALREMEVMGRISPLLGSVLSLAFLGDYTGGFVWLEDGKVIGNVTLQMADSVGARWRISNVAVAPSFRRRGIARRLMAAAVREVALRHGNWMVLQVRTDNPAAHQLYRDLGFTDVCRDGVWQLARLPAQTPVPSPAPELLRRQGGYLLLDLAHAARPPLAHWADPIRHSDFDLGPFSAVSQAFGRLIGMGTVQRWGVWEAQRLVAAVETTRATFGTSHHRLRFWARPEAVRRVEGALVAQGMASLAGARPLPVMAEHPSDHREGVAALEAAGFRLDRDLLTMRRPVRPEDEE